LEGTDREGSCLTSTRLSLCNSISTLNDRDDTALLNGRRLFKTVTCDRKYKKTMSLIFFDISEDGIASKECLIITINSSKEFLLESKFVERIDRLEPVGLDVGGHDLVTSPLEVFVFTHILFIIPFFVSFVFLIYSLFPISSSSKSIF